MHKNEPTLTTHINEVRAQYKIPDFGLSTIIYCGKVQNESDMTAALQIHRMLVEEEASKEQIIITGLLIGQGNSILHLIEGPCLSILRVLYNLAGHKHFLEPDYQSGSIIYNIEDRPKRFFPEWYTATIQEKKSQGEDITEENCTNIVYDMANRLLSIGTGLSKVDKPEDRDILKFSDKFPPKALVLSLAASNYFFSLEDYVSFYYDSFHIELESEQSWPIESLVNY